MFPPWCTQCFWQCASLVIWLCIHFIPIFSGTVLVFSNAKYYFTVCLYFLWKIVQINLSVGKLGGASSFNPVNQNTVLKYLKSRWPLSVTVLLECVHHPISTFYMYYLFLMELSRGIFRAWVDSHAWDLHQGQQTKHVFTCILLYEIWSLEVMAG